MGGGSWDQKLYSQSASYRASTGQQNFAYSHDTMSKSTDEWVPHDDLDPKKIKDSVNHVRESRDSAEHPESRAVITIFDVTGSMEQVPEVLQKKLEKLMTIIMMKGGLEHPQICVGAVGDAVTDHIPFQIAQFESDNKIDEHLRKIVLEGNGGGQIHESYALAAYFAAKLTAIDCFEKRGQKGYLFITGDEMPYDVTTKDQIKKIFGIKEEADIATDQIFKEAAEKYEIYFILPNQTSYYKYPSVNEAWRALLGDHLLRLEDPNAICELIASTIAVNEGIDVNDVAGSLKAAGADPKAIDSVTRALSKVTTTAPVKGAKSSGALPKSGAKDKVKTL